MSWQDDGVSPITIVSGYDRRLNFEEMDLAEYVRTRNPQLIRPLPGRQPRRFVCRPLSTDDHLACDAQASPERKFITALMFGLERFEDPEASVALMPTHDIPGRERAIWKTKDLEDLKRRAGGMQTLYEVGLYIYKRSDSLGNDWTGGDFSLAPPGLSAEAERLARLRAERTPEPATES